VNPVSRISAITAFVALALSGCGRPDDRGVTPPVVAGSADQPLKRRIEGIETMSFEELTHWIGICAPFNASPAAMAQNPYDQRDCDRVQIRRSEWKTPQTQKSAEYLPKVH